MAYSKLFAIREGDYMVTSGGFSCIAENTIVEIQQDENGLYFACAKGKHYLKTQLDESGRCVGLTPLI